MGIKNLLFLIMVLLFLPTAYSIDYYSDIEVEVDKSGFVSIKGNTNHPDLLTEATGEYTSKKQLFWLFNLSLKEEFSDYFVSVSLPEGSSINYVKSSGTFRIEEEGGRLLIKSFGEDGKISIIIQYQLSKEKEHYIGFFIILLVPVIGIFLYFMIKNKKIRIKKKVKKEDSAEETKYSFDGLTARQKKIMRLLIEKNKPLTQAEIGKEIKLPKSSVSRNIRSLDLKGKIEKEKAGMSNIIKLK